MRLTASVLASVPLLAVGLVMLTQPAAAQSLCRYVGQPGVPRPSPFWLAPPSELAPGEVVLEVVFENWASEPAAIPPPGVEDTERIITGGSCTRFVTYRVVRVIAGDHAAGLVRAQLSVADVVHTPNGPRLLVGRMSAYAHPRYLGGYTFEPAEVFSPRFPPP
jgi:hypothetical protein